MHDVVVGLLCFDQVIAPSTIIGKLHILLGSDMFWRLLREEALSFVHWQDVPGILFPDLTAVTGGRLTSITPYAQPGGNPIDPEYAIRRQIGPAEGRGQEFTSLLLYLTERMRVIPADDEEFLSLVRSVMMLPSVRSMLGFGDLVSLNSIPTWLMYPALRLANVVRIGILCRKLGLASAKFELGNDQLAGPVFTTAFGKESAERIAGYVATGRLSGDLGAFIADNPDALNAVLAFRASQQGHDLRRAIFEKLALSEGNEVVAAVNAQLSEMLPSHQLERARAKFSELFVAPTTRNLPAVLLDPDLQNNLMSSWRARSRATLEHVCKNLGVGRN